MMQSAMAMRIFRYIDVRYSEFRVTVIERLVPQHILRSKGASLDVMSSALKMCEFAARSRQYTLMFEALEVRH
jgi:hypothetical protein